MAAVTAFLDADVLLACVDDADPGRRDRARAWVSACWTRRCGRTSVEVLNEFYAQARRRFPTAISAGDARAEVRRYQHWTPWQIDHATTETAWAIESRHGHDWWDALVLASAQQQGCRYIVSGRWPDGGVVDRLRLVDPFTGPGPELLDAAVEDEAVDAKEPTR